VRQLVFRPYIFDFCFDEFNTHVVLRREAHMLLFCRLFVECDSFSVHLCPFSNQSFAEVDTVGALFDKEAATLENVTKLQKK
jgi:hypothetical protein